MNQNFVPGHVVFVLAAFLALGGCDEDVTDLDRMPVAQPVAASTTNIRSVTVELSGTHPEGTPLSFAIASRPQKGSLGAVDVLTATRAEVTYTPDAGFTGQDIFTYTVSDGTLTSMPGTVTIAVTANQRPVAIDRFAVTVEEEALAITVTASDRDNDPLQFAIVDAPANGTLGALNSLSDSTARVTYTPNGGFVGSDAFAFTTSDGAATSAPGTVSVSVRSGAGGRLSADRAHTCALAVSGAAYCWGDNDEGQLGSGATSDLEVIPQVVVGGHSFRQISAGTGHTCALTTAGHAFCWGDNAYGQLGEGTLTDRSAPAAVAGGHTFIQIVTGGEHTCGLSDQGQAYCWGDNSLAQLGDGTMSPGSAVPVPVGGEHVFFWLAGADHHTCGLDDAGRAFCWGFNDAGQLGDGTTTARRLPERVAGDHSFVDLAADYYHTCGLDEAGSTYCWGSNASALGDGSRVIQATPKLVNGTPAFVFIIAGGDHTCGLDEAGQAICWGVNDDGELGDGTTGGEDCGGFPPCRNTPLPVSGGHTFVWLDAGQDHNCGMLGTGELLCWGRNVSGQLGDGTTTGRTVPVGVVDPF